QNLREVCPLGRRRITPMEAHMYSLSLSAINQYGAVAEWLIALSC
ncbi:hypothetical protein LCGC14_3158970, partial [marine sediment metagenome]